MQDRALEYIQMIAKYNSILKASEKLYVTPSALSKYVQKIENELGVKLFDRMGKGFVLTYAGERYLDWQQRISTVREDMYHELRDIAQANSGLLRIGIPLSGADLLMDEVLPRFYEKCPNIRIELQEDTSSVLWRMLEENKLDLAILPNQLPRNNMEMRFLTRSYPVLLVPKDSAYVRMAAPREGVPYPWIDITVLADASFIAPFPDQSAYFLYEELQRSGFTPRITLHAKTFGTILQCIEKGFGITLTPDQMVKFSRMRDAFTMLSYTKQDTLEEEFVIASHKSHYLDRAAETFAQICQEVYGIAE